MDKCEIVTLSICHLPRPQETIGEFEVNEKPLSVFDDTKYMSSGDHSDQLISFFPIRGKQQKWWKKTFFHFLTLVTIQTMVLLNAHRRQHPRRNSTLAQVVKELVVSLARVGDITVGLEDEVNMSFARLRGTLYNPALSQKQLQIEKVAVYPKFALIERAKRTATTSAERKKARRLTTFGAPSAKLAFAFPALRSIIRSIIM